TAHDAVRDSEDLRRILALPRRVLDPTTADVDGVTARYARTGGTEKLRPHQALALLELEHTAGLLGPIGVGFGKTLLSFLAPVALAPRPAVYRIPPGLRDQVRREWLLFAPHFRLPNLAHCSVSYPDAPGTLHVVAYTELSSRLRYDILERIGPDLIIADE